MSTVLPEDVPEDLMNPVRVTREQVPEEEPLLQPPAVVLPTVLDESS